MLSTIRGISGQKLQRGKTVAVHKNWAQNRQATAVCDFCNRRNIPLQKCQDCIINICKNCTSQGTLQKDPRHMLASEAADAFEWYDWSKEKKTGALPSDKKRKNASRLSTPEVEDSVEIVLSPKRSEEAGGYPAPGSSLQYPPVRYSYPVPMSHNQRYNHGIPGLQPAGFPPYLNQYPQIPQYAHTLPPHGVYGYPAGQPIYNYAFPQQPTYALHSPQFPQISPESSKQELDPVPNGRGKAARSLRELSSQPESKNSYSRVTGGQLVMEASQALQAPPGTLVPAHRSLHSMQNEKIPDRRESIKHGEQTTPRQQNIASLAVSPRNLSHAGKKPQTLRQASDNSEQAVRGPKRLREVAEGFEQGSSNGFSGPERRPTKIPRHENIPQNTERRSRPISIARASKRTSMAFEGDFDDEDDSGRPVAKNVRRDKTPQSCVVKVQVKSAAGVQRLREILGTSHASDTKPSAIQKILPSTPSSSHNRPTFSSQALKKTRLDELLDAAGVQPVPWPAEVASQVPEVGRSRQYSAKTTEDGRKDSMEVLPSRKLHIGGQIDDDEAREAAMILLSMRRGRW